MNLERQQILDFIKILLPSVLGVFSEAANLGFLDKFAAFVF